MDYTNTNTKDWLTKYAKLAADNQVQADLSEISEDELGSILHIVYAIKNNSENYEPQSLKVMQALLDRYIRGEGCDFSILKDRKFITSGKVLSGKAIGFQNIGLGKRKGKADAVI